MNLLRNQVGIKDLTAELTLFVVRQMDLRCAAHTSGRVVGCKPGSLFVCKDADRWHSLQDAWQGLESSIIYNFLNAAMPCVFAIHCYSDDMIERCNVPTSELDQAAVLTFGAAADLAPVCRC